jgi:hypothetical protein
MNKAIATPILTLICSCFVMIGCNNKDQGPQAVNESELPIVFPVLRFDSAALHARFDSAQIQGYILQPYLPPMTSDQMQIQLIAYAVDSLGDYQNSWIPDTLRPVTDSAVKLFRQRIALGNSEITKEQLMQVVYDAQGRKLSYDYVVLVPAIEEVFHHLTYRIQAYKGKEKINNGRMQMTTPIPPSRRW